MKESDNIFKASCFISPSFIGILLVLIAIAGVTGCGDSDHTNRHIDATGTWHFEYSQIYASDGYEYYDADEEYEVVITQNGDDFTLVTKYGEIFEGSVSGDEYTAFFSELDGDESDTFEFSFTLDSEDSCTGMLVNKWSAEEEKYNWEGHWEIKGTKVAG